MQIVFVIKKNMWYKKAKLIEWCKEHYAVLKHHNLYGTGTTARMITDQTGFTVKGYNSGPLGGNQQIGAKMCMVLSEEVTENFQE